MSLLGGVYGRAAGYRRAWYGRRPDRARGLAQPVISVGNLTVGGSGKTPVVAALARLLGAAGESPSILTRGYGRRRTSDGVVVVSDGRQILVPTRESGDEPQMLARTLPRVPVLVSSDRYLAGRLAESRFGCTVHLLDDGFQHVQLARDIDLLVMSAVDMDERLLPWGRLRESLDTASAADALLVSDGPDVAASIGDRLGVVPTFHLASRYGSPRFLGPPDGSPEPGRRVVAVAGIARPERFFSALRDEAAGQHGGEGWDIAREIVFRDHHWFSRRDLDRIEHAAVDAGADFVLTTEKDAMRLEDVRTATGRMPWAFLPQQVEVEPAAAFAEWLHERLRTARLGRQPGAGQRAASSLQATEARSGDGGAVA
ncbi:MAG: tetraacyldisaccharide 4'-kinase [Acidobacteria bacterium]|nr:tetraacyldisaccharide 4'-kinase [Acidobacteriota bacterium]